MARAHNLPTDAIVCRRLCLPFAGSCLFPDNAICRNFLSSDSGPSAVESPSFPGGLQFSIPAEDHHGRSPWKYVVLRKGRHRWHCVGLSIDDNGTFTWYDSGKTCEYICGVGAVPPMEYWDTTCVTLGDDLSIHLHPRRGQPQGGKRGGGGRHAKLGDVQMQTWRLAEGHASAKACPRVLPTPRNYRSLGVPREPSCASEPGALRYKGPPPSPNDRCNSVRDAISWRKRGSPDRAVRFYSSTISDFSCLDGEFGPR